MAATPIEKLRAFCCGAALAAAACAAPTIEDEEELGRQRRDCRFASTCSCCTTRSCTTTSTRSGSGSLQAAGPQPFEYTFYVVEDDELNAFATSGGNVYVHTGMILRARNVSELAGVIGPRGRPRRFTATSRRTTSAQRNTGLAYADAAVLGGADRRRGSGRSRSARPASARTAYLNTFGRETESQADDFAVELLPRAGYDPEGIASMFEVLTAAGGPRGPKFFSDHPTSADRTEATKKLIAAKQLPPNLKRDDNGRLEIIQARIRVLTREPAKRKR